MSLCNNCEEINKILICPRCRCRFYVPKILPCGESICADCINALKEDGKIINCPFCDNIHTVPNYGFPTQKIITRILDLKPKQSEAYQVILTLINTNLNLLEEFSKKDTDDFTKIIVDHCTLLIQEIEKTVTNSKDATKKVELIDEINWYRGKCVAFLKKGDRIKHMLIAEQKSKVYILFENYKKHLKEWKTDIIVQKDMTDVDGAFIYQKCLAMENFIINAIKFYESILFDCTQPRLISNANIIEASSIVKDLKPISISKPVTSKTAQTSFITIDGSSKLSQPPSVEFNYTLKYDDFNYLGILHIENIRRHRMKMIQIDSNKVLQKKSPSESVISTRILLLNNNNILIIMHVLEESSIALNKLKLKIMDKFQNVLVEDNEFFESKEIVMVNTTLIDIFFVTVNHIFNAKSQLYVYNYKLEKIKVLYLESDLLCIDSDISNIYLLTNKYPLIHNYTWDFEEYVRFGQTFDAVEPFYMKKPIKIFVRFECLYVRDACHRDIKVYDLKSGICLTGINLNLEGCFLNIDFLGRIITLDKKKKILSIHDRDSVFALDKKFKNIDEISSFGIGPGGHLLIYNYRDRVIYIY